MKPIKIIRSCTVANSVDFIYPMIPELKDEGYDVKVLCSSGKDTELVVNVGGEVLPVDMERHISPIKDLKSLFKIIKVFRRERPTMVHSMTPKAGLLSMMAGWLCRVPVRVHTFTGLVWPTASGLKRRVLMFTDWVTCACATHIIPEGEGVKADLLNHHITRKPIRVLGHGNVKGIDLNRFDPENPEVVAEAAKLRRDDVFTFVFVGRLVGDKGINELVAAFKRLQDWSTSSRPDVSTSGEAPHHTPSERDMGLGIDTLLRGVGPESRAFPGDVRLVLVGRQEEDLDPLKEETLAEIERNRGIEAVGPKMDVRPWYAMADAFVFPSYREGFPNCVIEAGAMMLPSIVTDINGSREIIEDGVNGIIIPSKDEDALYEAMKRMVESKENASLAPEERTDDVKPRMEDDEIVSSVWVRMKRNARPMISARFEQNYVRKCLKDFYREVLGE